MFDSIKPSIFKTLFLLAVYCYDLNHSYAALVVENFSGAPVPTTFFGGFDISSDIKYGSLVSADTDVFKGASLSGVGVGAEAVLGWPVFFIGGGADYSKLYQIEQASELDDMNASGTLMNAYGLIGFYLIKWRFSFKYFLSSTYTFDQKTIGGQDFELSAPESSFGLDITVGGSEGRALSFEFNSLSYGEYNLGDGQREFNASARPQILTYGVVYAIRY